MSDNIEKCKLYLVTLSNKQVNVYIPFHYEKVSIDEFLDNAYGETEWHNYREVG